MNFHAAFKQSMACFDAADMSYLPVEALKEMCNETDELFATCRDKVCECNVARAVVRPLPPTGETQADLVQKACTMIKKMGGHVPPQLSLALAKYD